MRVRRNLTQPVVAATLLAGLVLPQAEAMAVPAPPPQPVLPEHVQAALPVPAQPVVKKVVFRREAASIRYRVKEGDCLWFIARAYLGRGREWRSIYAANRDQIRNPDLIYPGQVFTIPRRSGVVQSRHARVAEQHRHRIRTAERLGEHQIAASELLRHSSQRPQRLSDDSFRASDRAGALPPPNPELTRNSALVGDTFQGHGRVDGHFYRIQEGQLVWADNGKPVRGEWAKRLTQQIYPNQEAAQPVQAAQAPVTDAVAEAPAAETQVEPTIQGHRRVNGTFFVRQPGGLVWADDGTPVRPGAVPVKVAP